MARRFQEITEVYRQEIAALARSDRWTAFLRSACRNYKLPFEEQVLVHAQRPDATAVLEIERWNRQFGRWVNKGATGIAVFDRDYPGRTRLKYYFDISDTHESRLSRPVPLWQVPTEQEPDVIEALENRFGALDDKGTLEEAIVSAMENAAADNMTDYLDDLQNCRDNSLLEELDELNLSVLYRRLLENSTAYMLMCRCGLEPDEYFDPEDFSEVFNFNTPETLNALGVATRDIAESGLSAIAYTPEGRAEIHKNLGINTSIMLALMRIKEPRRSVEYMDNRISLYAAQYGRCAVTGKELWLDEIHCHHKQPLCRGGTDKYMNLVIVHRDIHRLIHATDPNTIAVYLNLFQLDKKALAKLNALRVLAGQPEI